MLKDVNHLLTKNPKFQKNLAKHEEVRALPCLAEELKTWLIGCILGWVPD